MKSVHGRFTGHKGTIANFGDSITVTMAYWAPLSEKPKNLNPAAQDAVTLVQKYVQPECWRAWKGPKYGSEGRMTIRWARANVQSWLKALNPECAVIMFGSNDVGELDAAEYDSTYRDVVRQCLSNGTVVVVTTAPPRHGRLEKSRQFAEVVRKIAQDEHLPLIDYAGEILQRRSNDWDGALPQFKDSSGDDYQVPTLIARDGVHPSNPAKWVNDFSEDGLKTNGYALRNFLTLITYADVVKRVLN